MFLCFLFENQCFYHLCNAVSAMGQNRPTDTVPECDRRTDAQTDGHLYCSNTSACLPAIKRTRDFAQYHVLGRPTYDISIKIWACICNKTANIIDKKLDHFINSCIGHRSKIAKIIL